MSEVQAKAILDLRLHRLTGLERDKIGGELREITDKIIEYLEILSSRTRLFEVMREELQGIRDRFATPRRTELCDAEFESDIEDLIQREDMVVTITHTGYVKRTQLSVYREQRRGGKGRSGLNMKDEDFVSELFVSSTHTPLLIFTNRGIVHRMKVWQLPLGSPQSKGKALINLLPFEEGEKISVIMALPEDEETWNDHNIMFATAHGSVRRNKLSDFKNIRSNGLIAMKLGEGEDLVSVALCAPEDTVILAARQGKAIRFNVEDIRVFAGRASTGVRGMKLAEGNELIGMSIIKHEPEDMPEEERQVLLCVSEKGYGKRTYAREYRISGRGGQGVINMDVTEKTGELVATFPVTPEHQIMLVTDGGQMIRTGVADVRITGRSAQGVKLFDVSKGEKVVSVASLVEDDEEDEDIIEGEAMEVVEGEAGAEVIELAEVTAQAEDATDDEPKTDGEE
jgi:DNA gyrase subunit A